MTHFEPEAEWFHAAAEAEANRIVSVGGLAVKIARAELRERLAERAALAPLLDSVRARLRYDAEEAAHRPVFTGHIEQDRAVHARAQAPAAPAWSNVAGGLR